MSERACRASASAQRAIGRRVDGHVTVHRMTQRERDINRHTEGSDHGAPDGADAVLDHRGERMMLEMWDKRRGPLGEQ